MSYREIIAVFSEIHTKHINTLCGQNVELMIVKLVVHIATSGLYRVNFLCVHTRTIFCLPFKNGIIKWYVYNKMVKQHDIFSLLIVTLNFIFLNLCGLSTDTIWHRCIREKCTTPDS
jgi:hypothetical protein